MIELRLMIIEDGNPDYTAAYRFSPQELADMKIVPRNPFAQALASERDKWNDPKAHIIRVAKMLGSNVADYRDDRDGHNGERRAERIAAKEAKS
jgi:hypothetical protein